MTDQYRVRIRRDDIEVEVESTDREYVDEKLNLYLGSPQPSLPTPQAGGGSFRGGAKSQSLQEFIRIVKPDSGIDHVVAITYYYEQFGGKSELRTKDIREAFRALKVKYSNVPDAVAKARVAGLLMDGASKGTFVASKTGEDWVETALKGG